MIAKDNAAPWIRQSRDGKSLAPETTLTVYRQENCRSEPCATEKGGVPAPVPQTRGSLVRVWRVVLVLAVVMCGPVGIVHSAHGDQGNILLPGESPALVGKNAFNTFSGQESSPQALPGSLAALRANIHIGVDPEQRENSSVAENPYDILREEDTALKRKARLQGMRMRTLYGPEAAYQGAFVDSQEESGSRHTFAAVMPLAEIWEGAVFNHLSFFSLKGGNDTAGRESVNLRIGMNPGRTFRPWFALTPYFNFGDAEGQGVGIAAGMSKTWRNGANLSGEAFAWRPWDEGYYTIVEDGRKHGAGLAFTLPFTNSFTLSSRAYYEELELGGGAKSGEQDAGNRYMINTRAYYRLLHRDGAYMGYGFRDDNLWDEYLVGSELGIFMQVDFQRYFKPDGFDALNPVPEVFAQELGLSFQYAFSPHVGLTAEGFIGRDPDRDLQFGELAGVNGRLTVVANPHLRIWAGASYMKTSTTLESSGGKETIVSSGINYAF